MLNIHNILCLNDSLKMLKDFCEGKARGEKVSSAQYNYSNQSKVFHFDRKTNVCICVYYIISTIFID